MPKTYPNAPYGWVDMYGKNCKAYDKEEIDKIIEQKDKKIQELKDKIKGLFERDDEIAKILKQKDKEIKDLKQQIQEQNDLIIDLEDSKLNQENINLKLEHQELKTYINKLTEKRKK